MFGKPRISSPLRAITKPRSAEEMLVFWPLMLRLRGSIHKITNRIAAARLIPENPFPLRAAAATFFSG